MDHKSAVANSLLTTVFLHTIVMFGLLATVLIAMKAARMLSEPSSWTDADPEDVSIDLTFSIKSLYETLTDLVERFFGQFNGPSLEEADATLDILHGWGGRKTGDGICYRLSSQTQDVRYKNYSLASREYPDADDLQEPMAKEVLEAGDIPQIWDAILIDEAQDFGPKFLNMCREAITEENRLIWAYDEAQDLSSLTAPSRKTCLGPMRTEMQSSTSAGSIAGPQKTFVMRKSYRAPRLLLILAHTIGMGLKREDGPVQAITRQDGWDGYDVDGNFRKIGSEAVLRRPVENSPHPMQNEFFPGELIAHRSIETKADEHWVSKKIKADIQQEGVDPDQILVIPLCKGHTNDMENKEFVAEELESLLGRHDIQINPVWENDNKIFTHEGKVTLAGVNRAKGDEAGSVYVLGVDAINTEQWRDQEIHKRNRLFVAITRSGA